MSSSESKFLLKSMKDIILSSISGLSSVGMDLTESNIDDSLMKIKILADKLTLLTEIKKSVIDSKSSVEAKTEAVSPILPREGTIVTVGKYSYHIRTKASLLYVNDKLLPVKWSYFHNLMDVKSFSDFENDTLGRLFFISKVMTEMRIVIPLLIYICYTLLGGGEIKCNFTIDLDPVYKVETLNIVDMNYNIIVTRKINDDYNCVTMKNWLDQIVKD